MSSSRRPLAITLNVAPGQVDLARFEQLVAAARPLEPEARSAKLREALELWRGPPLADFTFEPFAETEIARLEELRAAAVEERIEADLDRGQAAELVGELEGLAKENPLRERLRGQLMLALYRSGRQAEALRVYQETRRLLVDELGIEPTPCASGASRLDPAPGVGAATETDARAAVSIGWERSRAPAFGSARRVLGPGPSEEDGQALAAGLRGPSTARKSTAGT